MTASGNIRDRDAVVTEVPGSRAYASRGKNRGLPDTQSSHGSLLRRSTRLRFYRAMLCIGRTMLSKDVCPSLSLSHAGIVSKRLNIIVKLFPLSGSHTILIFPYHTLWQYTDWDIFSHILYLKTQNISPGGGGVCG